MRERGRPEEHRYSGVTRLSRICANTIEWDLGWWSRVWSSGFGASASLDRQGRMMKMVLWDCGGNECDSGIARTNT